MVRKENEIALALLQYVNVLGNAITKTPTKLDQKKRHLLR